DPLISHSDLNQIQIDNGRHLSSTNSELQNYSVPLDIVLNDSEYENMFNALHDQFHQSYNAAQTSRINISPPSQATILQLNSNLNYEDTISNQTQNYHGECAETITYINDPSISHSDLNQIQMENLSNSISINRVHQLSSTRCPVSINVLNDLDYENFYNLLHTTPHRLHNVEQTSIINMSTPQSTVLNSLNYLVEYNASNATLFPRSPRNDPPPSYDECIASSRLIPRSIH
ncbi:hypothetical protein AGLY_010382, partial [Aphis glycines]